MQSVSIRTTQNVQLDYPLAGIADRFLAFAIDMLIILSFFVITSFILTASGLGESSLVSIILGIVAYLYRFVSEILMNGQTVGKMALSIKVVKLDGSKPSVAAFFLRWLLEVIDFFIMGLGMVFIILTKNGQRIGDILAGTTVVKMKKVSLTNIQNKAIMDPVNEAYEPVFVHAAELTDDEVKLIKRSLAAYRDKAHKKPIETIAIKLKDKYQIQTDLPTVKFLYTLLRDHTHYVSQ